MKNMEGNISLILRDWLSVYGDVPIKNTQYHLLQDWRGIELDRADSHPEYISTTRDDEGYYWHTIKKDAFEIFMQKLVATA